MNNAIRKKRANGGGLEKNYWRIIPRYSPEWINSIPKSLARGIWDTIQRGIEDVEGKHTGAAAGSGSAESARRRKQIQKSCLRDASRGTVELSGCDDGSALAGGGTAVQPHKADSAAADES